MNKNGNLLIIDDEPEIARILAFTLKKHAEEVFICGNGHEALEILKTFSMNCVLCDLDLIQMNGLDILKELRYHGKDTPFVIFTGEEGNRETLLEAALYGASEFLYKPDFDGVENAVKSILSNGNYIPRAESEYGKILKELNR